MPANLPIIARIFAKGQPLTLGLGTRVLQFQYEDSEKEDDLFNVTFSDPFGELVDSDQFQEGTEWSVQWGFAGKLHPPRKVIVKRPRFAYGQVEIQALDKGSELKLAEAWTTYKKTTLQNVLQDIASSHGLKLDMDPVNLAIPFLAMGGRSHFDILKTLTTRTSDHFFKVVGDTLQFKKRNLNAPPVGRFAYAPGRDSRLISFDIQIKDQDNAKSSLQTTAVTVDPFTQKTKSFSADEGSSSTENLGNVRVTKNYVTSFSNTIRQITGASLTHKSISNTTGKSLALPPKMDAELNAIVEGKRHEALLDNVEANFEISAAPEDGLLKSGDLIEVRGIGKKFSGMYQILSIRHDLNDGYKYSITGKRNAVGATGSFPETAQLNGPINIKGAVEKLVELVEITVVGSLTGSIYGQTGRIL